MLDKEDIKEIAFENGVDLFGVASIDRFDEAPKGFNPRDIYSKTNSVIVFAIGLPTETLFAESPIPYTHVNSLAMSKIDAISYGISCDLERKGLKSVLIPTDDPYLEWDETKQEGRAILSLRHAAYLAGLGKIARNNLLINRNYGNMIQIGALLTGEKFESDPMADYEVCPPGCSICIDNCPETALTGDTVIQKNCRELATYRTNKGYIIKKCFECRKNCPSSLGLGVQ
jgi:epoxyqueuosine reductase QueG